jgi:nicotinamide riboside kinase
MENKKKIITDTVFGKISYKGGIKFSEIDIKLEPDDVILSGHEEAEYHSDGGMDAHYYMTIYRDRLETDEELKERMDRVNMEQIEMKKRRYENYLKLKKEFEEDGK